MKRYPVEEASSKEERLLRLAEATIDILVQGGISALTHSRAARAANVSRPWIYKYIGKSTDDLIEFAMIEIGTVLAELKNRKSPVDREEFLSEFKRGTERLFHHAVQSPQIFEAYFKFQGKKNAVGSGIERIESRYLKKFSQELRAALKLEESRAHSVAKALTTIRMGFGHRLGVDRSLDPRFFIDFAQSVAERL